MGVDYTAWCGFGVWLDYHEVVSKNGKKLVAMLEERDGQIKWDPLFSEGMMGNSGFAVVLKSSYRSLDVKYGEDPVEIPVLTTEEMETARIELAELLAKYGFVDVPPARWWVGGRIW
jgi:hypothetical protein